MLNKNPEEQKKYYSVAELAEALHVSRITIFNRIKNGQIVAEKFGRSYSIPAKVARPLLRHELSEKLKKVVDIGVHRAVSEYAETLRLLGKE